jgi:hypothetical protein
MEPENKIELAPEVKAFLDKRGFTSLDQVESTLDGYKTDVTRLKGENKTLSAEQKDYQLWKAEAEKRKEAELSDLQKMQLAMGEKDNHVTSLTATITSLEKARIQDRVLFEHSIGKNILGTRMKLYEMASSAQEWATPEELKVIFSKVDADFDAELKGVTNIKPAPGDTYGGGSSGATLYSPEFFKGFFNKKPK